MAILVDWVCQSVSGTPGTGTITLGSAVNGFIRFQDDTRLTDGATVYYTIEDGANRERGIGTYTASGTTLARTVIHAKIESGSYSENPGTGLDLTSNAIVSCSAIAATHNFRGCVLTHSTTQPISSAATTVLDWDTESLDTDNFHDTVTNNSRITIPSNKGIRKVRLIASVSLAGNATGQRITSIMKNSIAISTQVCSAATGLGGSYRANVTILDVDVSDGDYYQATIYQDSGGSLNANNIQPLHWFSLEVVE